MSRSPAAPDQGLTLAPLMETIDAYAFQPIRRGIYKSTGFGSPSGRLIVYTALYSAALFATQPTRCFSNGSPRPWALLGAKDNATYVPFWLEAFTVGYVAHLFI